MNGKIFTLFFALFFSMCCYADAFFVTYEVSVSNQPMYTKQRTYSGRINATKLIRFGEKVGDLVRIVNLNTYDVEYECRIVDVRVIDDILEFSCTETRMQGGRFKSCRILLSPESKYGRLIKFEREDFTERYWANDYK